ncbi:MAG: pantoate--beta-alanine ligase [Sulfurimicrobium sp.]|jgi:pantoate--beta-alanine ligase|nr:pantoate--beta-alanine ligase [Sulfurimicrobium sp.]MDP1703366.1 pantoate--beta-alanine ligase [Sulfurimicrobium sp.]MDP1898065.1 pantoate--beta-alanine ligase [Sulfurimicrobium sp.]MDP2199488.1 pantoate--beta-alanine ligase [Sulfurimicrobium sp.]MDP2962527.1 pantoate--beta-alanine ligase [Sulfurimicrobium sp.]
MEIISTIAVLRETLQGRQPVVFVPTMGNLHEGHIALAELARQHGRTVVVSIFVNPLQFGPGEDLAKYPRTLEADCRKLQAAGADIVFTPSAEELFPTPQQFQVEPPPFANELCGAFRPGHFRGVATIVLKLFNIVQPACAVFGKKDYQQLFIIRGMVREFDLPLKIFAGETQRAEDGLALSSRNGYLKAEERAEAPRLYQNLRLIHEAVTSGRRDFATLESAAAADLARHGWQVDYISLRNAGTLQPAQAGDAALVVLGAARLGTTRLIDNVEFRSAG